MGCAGEATHVKGWRGRCLPVVLIMSLPRSERIEIEVRVERLVISSLLYCLTLPALGTPPLGSDKGCGSSHSVSVT